MSDYPENALCGCFAWLQDTYLNQLLKKETIKIEGIWENGYDRRLKVFYAQFRKQSINIYLFLWAYRNLHIYMTPPIAAGNDRALQLIVRYGGRMLGF